MVESATAGRRPSDFRRVRLALLLSATAGFVDAVGWQALSRIYTANMTGNTVAMGRALAVLDVRETMLRAWPVVTFVAGLLACALALEWARRRGSRRAPALIFAVEAALLVAFAVAARRGVPPPPGIRFHLLVALPAFAMGLQNATLTRVGALSVRTTHVTGTLSRMADLLAKLVIGLHDRVRHGRERAAGPGRGALLLLSLWIVYAAAATAAFALIHAWALWALTVPAAALAAVSAVAAMRPYPALRAS